jgi:hypothetical protein
MGVWWHTANGSVKLHHTGVMWGPDGTIANIFTDDEVVRVAPNGTTYEGSWDFKIYAPTDVLGTGTVLQEISGAVAATRALRSSDDPRAERNVGRVARHPEWVSPRRPGRASAHSCAASLSV